MKNLLITGGTGNLGKVLSNVLKEKGFSFAVASRSNKENSPQKVVMDLLENKCVAFIYDLVRLSQITPDLSLKKLSFNF